VPNDNKILRFDPRSLSYREWEMPAGHMPNSVIADRSGTLWTAGFGNGTIGRIRPGTGMIAEFAVPSGGGGPHSLVLSEDGETIWFTMQTGDKIGSLDTATGRIAELDTSGSPTGITLDPDGNVWWCRSGDNKLGRLEPRSGRISEIDLGRSSRPRRIATAADGSLWVTLYGKGQFARIDPQTAKVVKTYTLSGGNAGAHALATDDRGNVWISQLKNDTIVRFDAATETMQSIVLPARNYGIRKLAVDAAGRLWFAGSQNGRIGFIE
jgi:virginiamycin B lyase